MKLFNRNKKTSRICGRIYNELNSNKIGIERKYNNNATRSETNKSKKKAK